MIDERMIRCTCGREYNAARLERCPACGTRPGQTSAERPAAPEPAGVPASRVTTTSTLAGYTITRSFGVVTSLSANSGWTATSKGNNALDQALAGLRKAAAALGANAIVGLSGGPFGAHGGLTSGFGGDAVGILLLGTAVRVHHSGDDARTVAGSALDDKGIRQQAIAAAIQQDPTLREDDPETLSRLVDVAHRMEAQLRVRAERALVEAAERAASASPAPVVPLGSDDEGPGASGSGLRASGAPVPPERVLVLSDSDKAALAQVRPPSTEPGWHPDPLGQHTSRYWNGQQWTGRVRAGS